jgi:glucose/arabinose dehydrogenase
MLNLPVPRIVLALLVLLFFNASPLCARDVTKLYAELCANCHGKDLQGGQAPSLVDDVWKFGGDDAAITHSIREGNLTNGMVPWKDVLSDAEIRAMVVFFREKGAGFKRQGITYPRPKEDEVVRSQEHAFRIKSVAEGLAVPWSIAFLPGDRMLVTELRGTLRELEQGRLLPEPVAGTPKVRFDGQGGLIAVAAHPGFATNGWIYLAYSDRGSNAAGANVSLTALVRGRIRDHQWVDEETVFRAPVEFYKPSNIHFGTRIVFDRDGHVFFPIGERGVKEDAQDLSKPNGKVHRLRDDGKVPADNPFVRQANAFPSIWSYGNRNAQGLALHPVTGELWETEHGPRGGDELNLIRRGANYGWPVITYGMDYNGSPISALTAKEGMEQPITHWTPSIAVCALAFYTGDRFPRWKNQTFVTALAQQELRRVVIDGHNVTKQEVLFKDLGRVRDVATGPDGFLYVILNQPDRIIRLEPAE